jgi:hypothetical protein
MTPADTLVESAAHLERQWTDGQAHANRLRSLVPVVESASLLAARMELTSHDAHDALALLESLAGRDMDPQMRAAHLAIRDRLKSIFQRSTEP